MKSGFFITGTDTDVGKTIATCSLLHAFSQKNLKTLGVKPLASGADYTPEGLKNQDALMLQEWSTLKLPYSHVNPIVFQKPIAPHLAAAQSNEILSVENILSRCHALTQDYGADLTLVEGAGGWKVPLNDQETMADLAMHLNFHVIFVVGLRLGCLSHALLTYESILRKGLPIAGWIANHIEEDFSYAIKNIETLKQFISFPLIGVIPYQKKPNPAFLSNYLDTSSLFSKTPSLSKRETSPLP